MLRLMWFILVTVWLLSGCGTSRELLLAGRVYEFPDRAPAPEPPAHEPNAYFDFIDNSFSEQIESIFDIPRHVRALVRAPKQATNIDAFDEVGNSSWFTNRALTLTLEEAIRGPDTNDGPDMSAPWRVADVKTQGVTPGFRIQDVRGDLYLLKFDPVDHPELATGTEIISTKLAYAVGYNTPESYPVFFTEDQLVIEGEVTITDEFGKTRILRREDVLQALGRTPRTPDGKYRAVASKFIEGKPIGPFAYISQRRSDLNDVFRHEHRRELRGLQPFAALINHNDSRRINTLDVYTRQRYVKHYLIDLGSALGSASWGVNYPSEGFEYILDFGTMTKSALSLGLYKRPWRRHDQASGIPSVGYFGVDGFEPRHWKPNYPNLAFQRMTNRDGFWGARLIMALSDDKIRGIVEQARFTDPAATDYLTETLITRRDRIGRYWYAQVSPLDRFIIESIPDGGQRITFTDLAVEAGFEAAAQTSYRFELMHNDFGGFDEVLRRGGEARYYPAALMIPHERQGAVTAITLRADLLTEVETWLRERKKTTPGERLFYLEIYTRRSLDGSWGKWLKLHLRFHDQNKGFTLAGIERKDR